MKLTRQGVVLGFALVLIGGLPLYAQQNVGGIVGTVTDSSGAVIPGAATSAVNQGTGLTFTTRTSSSGYYTFTVLPIGRYRVTVSVTGFQTFNRSDIEVVSGETVTIDARLLVGQSTQVVNVSGGAPLMDTVSSTEATTETERQIEDLPILEDSSTGRSGINFLQSFAGVSSNPNESGGSGVYVYARSQVNGIPSGAWAFNIDGVDAGQGSAERGHDNNPITPDMVEEVRLSANSDVSVAFTPGVALELTEKSGTNKVHGSLFEYFGNRDLDSRNFFFPGLSMDSRNEWGFVLGGPVYIPKIYDGRNKTFFIVNWDWFRYRTNSGATTTEAASASVPTALMREGNFSQLLGSQIGTDALGRPVYAGEIYDPSTTQALPGGGFIRNPYNVGGILNNMGPVGPGGISPISAALVAPEALPSLPGAADNWAGPSSESLEDKNSLFMKFDEILNPANRFTFAYDVLTPFTLLGEKQGVNTGYSGNSWITGSPGYLGPDISAGYIDDRDEYRLRFNYVWTAKPNLLVSFRMGVTRTPRRLESRFPIADVANFGAQIGLTGTLLPQTPSVIIAGYSPLAYPGWDLPHFYTPEQNIPANLDVDWIKGAHNFKFGVNFINVHSVYIDQGVGYGDFSFAPAETGLPGFPTTGSGEASFLSGWVDSASVGSPQITNAVAGGWGFFGQDTWRVRPKLTLTLGLRWDLFIPTHEEHNRVGGFDPTLPNPGAGDLPGALSVWGTGPGLNGLRDLNTWYLGVGALGEQVGIAYSLNPKTVIRTSFGVTHGAGYTKWLNSQFNNVPSPGFSATLTSQTLNAGVTPAFNWNTGFPLTFPQFPTSDPSLENGSTLGYIARNLNKPEQFENLGFEVDREIPLGILLKVGYVGTFAHYIPTQGMDDLNALPLSAYSLGSLLTQNINSAAAVAAGIKSPYAGFNGSVAQALLPYPQYYSVPVLADPDGNSAYNALQIYAEKRVGHGLTLLGSYTASKTLTNAFENINGNGGADVQNPLMKNTAKHLDNADRPQILKLSWTYDLPFGTGKRFGQKSGPVLNKFIGGWQFAAIQTYEAGRPLEVTTEASLPYASVWPVLNKGVPIIQTPCGNLDPGNPLKNTYLNPAAFSTPAAYTFGNVSTLSTVRGCGYVNENLAFNKAFDIGEGKRFRFGVTGINVFNRHEWIQDDMTLDINSPAFGEDEDAFNGRSFQFYGRFEF